MSRGRLAVRSSPGRSLLLLLAVLLTGCGKHTTPSSDRYVTTGFPDGLAFVASLEGQPPILEHVALKDIPLRLGESPLLRDGVLKVAREAGFDGTAEVVWVRTSPGSGSDMRTGLALELVDRRRGRDADWWGRVSRQDGKVVVDQVMGGGHERR